MLVSPNLASLCIDHAARRKNEPVLLDASETSFDYRLPKLEDADQGTRVCVVLVGCAVGNKVRVLPPDAEELDGDVGNTVELFCKGDEVEFIFDIAHKWRTIRRCVKAHVADIAGKTFSEPQLTDDLALIPLDDTHYSHDPFGLLEGDAVVIKRAGFYDVNASMGVINLPGGKKVELRLHVNGVAQQYGVAISPVGETFVNLTRKMHLEVGDEVSIQAQHNDGTNLYKWSGSNATRPRLGVVEVR